MKEGTLILNVDDHEINRYARSRVLKTAGYRVVEAANGYEALRMAGEMKPALILLDVNMPDINGFEVARRIKNDPSMGSVLILQISASLTDPLDKANALEAGADSYLTDPLEPAELLATVRALLRLRDAELQWKLSEQHLRAMFENAAVGIAHVALDGKFLLINDKLCEITGYTRNLLEAMAFQEITHPDDLAEDLDQGKRLINGEIDSYTLEKRYIRQNGSYVWVNLTVSLVRDAVGTPQYFVSVVDDITERKQAANRLRESEDRLRLALDSSATGIHVWDIKENTFYWDEQVRRLWGITSDEEVSYDVFINGLHPDDREKTQIAIDLALNPQEDGEYFAEYRVVGRDDRQTRWIASTGQVFFERDAAVRLVGTARDVSSAKIAEERLRRSEANLRLATEAAKMYSWEYDLETQMTTLGENFARVLDLKIPISEIDINEAFARFIHPDDRDQVAKYLHDSIQNQTPAIEVRLINPESGDLIWVETNCYLVRRDNGLPSRLVGVSQNITDRKNADAERQMLLEAAETARGEAEAANRSKDEFLAVLSHELRAPLNAMYGWTRILQTSKLDQQKTRQAIDVIARNVALQNTLIEDLLDASRIISGKMRIEPESASLFSIVSSAVETARPAAEKRGVALHLDLDPTADKMLGDADRLQQVVGNLLTNALKFTPAGGSVAVKTRRSRNKNTAVIQIRDTGSGIEPEFLPYIFDRFKQADSSTKRKFGGLGLGLTIVKNLVELHGGTVSAASEGAGLGTTFTIELPLLPDDVSSSRDLSSVPFHANGENRGVSLGGIKILIIDDDPDSLELICFALKQEGADVACHNSAADALTELRQRSFDLLISDLGMSEMDGFDLIENIRRQDDAVVRLIPAIALTGYVSAEDRERTLRAGFQAHMSKPVDLASLSHVIINLVQNDPAVG